MIETRLVTDFAALARRLAERAQAIARARVAEQRAQARSDPARWRDPSLLWPLFTKD